MIKDVDDDYDHDDNDDDHNDDDDYNDDDEYVAGEDDRQAAPIGKRERNKFADETDED